MERKRNENGTEEERKKRKGGMEKRQKKSPDYAQPRDLSCVEGMSKINFSDADDADDADFS